MFRRLAYLLAALAMLATTACEQKPASITEKPIVPKATGKPTVTESAPLKDEIPTEVLSQVIGANRQGIGYLEQFEYAKATEQFRTVRKLAPGWIAGSINLSIALLNDSGTKAEDQKKQGTEANAFANNFQEALALLDDVLKRDSKNLYAHYCRGLILQFLMSDVDHPENLVRAHEDFQAVVDGDPTDGHAWYRLAETLYDPATKNSPDGPRLAGPEGVGKKIELLNKALERSPYLVSAYYQLQLLYGQQGKREESAKLRASFQQLNPKTNPAAPGDLIGSSYGSSGRYSEAIDPIASRPTPGKQITPPKFDVPQPLKITLPAGHRWAKSTDFTGKFAIFGRAKARFGATIAAFDADGDTKTDLYLAAAVVGPKGLRDALLLNKGDGKFEDATEALGIPTDRVSLGVAASDFDADRLVDLFLTGVGDNRLLRNVGKKGFEDVTKAAGITPSKAVSLTARWMDIDQDGDIDLYVINTASADQADHAFGPKPPPGSLNTIYRNDGKPSAVASRPPDNWAPLAVAGETPSTTGLSIVFTPWGEGTPMQAGASAHTGIAFLDLDDDRDVDIVVSSDGSAPVALINDRLGKFRAVSLDSLGSKNVNGLLSIDLDKDGRVDLVSIEEGGRVNAWLNTTDRLKSDGKPTFSTYPCDVKNWRSAIANDLDLDTWTDLVGLPNSDKVGPLAWARHDGTRLVPNDLAIAPEGSTFANGLALVDLVGDALPEVVTTRDGDAPLLAKNLGNGMNWVAFGLGGRWKTSHDHMRSNAEGLGTRITIEGEGLDVKYSHTSPTSSLAQSTTPIVLGLGTAKEMTLVHIRWPDGVLQCELNMPVNTRHDVAEYNRKTGSCPVLFTWNGDRFVCLGDFLGGGGMGYLVAPGVYGQPDRDEAVAIAPDQLKAVNGVYRLSITEPMDEIAYLDHLMLEVVDRPPGVLMTPDERFAPEGPRPTGEIIAWSKQVEPVKALDHLGKDVTDLLKHWDRRTVDDVKRLRGWIGYTEDHAITLDFGDRLKSFKPTDRLVLCLAGWVEYPYSQTNYAAATAGTTLKPPVLERKQADGTWKVINPSPGYPAGMPRMMTVEITGQVGGDRCELRLTTNMECYWDQAFIAVRNESSGVKSSMLPVARATLGYRGYTREVSPDGRLPLLYDYDYVDPAPLARLEGKLTRYGEVASLLQADDDQLCLVGPGDEVRLEFDTKSLPDLPKGWTRSYVLRSIGYCKDADPFTATSDHVGPLPWKGMPEFPFLKPTERPLDPAYELYLKTYQTRAAANR
jgi:hypothetical protein